MCWHPRGYPAVATASAAISASLGFEDGEKITRRTMLEVIHRISRSVAVPVTADIEAGYGASVAELEDTIRGLVDTGAVGMNIEDSLEEGGPLRPADEQAERIATVREAAAARGLDLVINARVDTFCRTGSTRLRSGSRKPWPAPRLTAGPGGLHLPYRSGRCGGWISNRLASQPDAPLRDRWLSIPAGVWHQGVLSDKEWVVVSFHTVPAEELIEERPDEAGEGTTKRHYLG